jgi:hypothetical protein
MLETETKSADFEMQGATPRICHEETLVLRAGQARGDAADGVFSSDGSCQSQTRAVAGRDPWLTAAGDELNNGRREHCRTAEMETRTRQACKGEKMTIAGLEPRDRPRIPGEAVAGGSQEPPERFSARL